MYERASAIRMLYSPKRRVVRKRKLNKNIIVSGQIIYKTKEEKL